MENYGIKVSVKGKDVKTAAGNDLLVDSKKKCFKTGEVHHATITTNAYGNFSGLLSAHNLGFVPNTEIALSYKGSFLLEPIYDIFNYLYFYSEISVTDINVTLNDATSPNTTFDVYFWISETENSQ